MANQFFQKLMMIPKGKDDYSLAVPKVKAILAALIFCVALSVVNELLGSMISWELKISGIITCVLSLGAFAFWFNKNKAYVREESSRGFWDFKGRHIVIPLKSWGGIYFFWLQQFVVFLLLYLLIDRGFLFFSFLMIIGGAYFLGHQKFHVSLRIQWVVLAIAFLVVYALLCLDPVSLPITSKKGLLA